MTAMLYDDLVKIAEDFLGPAGKRFLDRQISSHLKKKPEEISKSDIKTLAKWATISVAFLTEDEKQVIDFNNKILSLDK